MSSVHINEPVSRIFPCFPPGFIEKGDILCYVSLARFLIHIRTAKFSRDYTFPYSIALLSIHFEPWELSSILHTDFRDKARGTRHLTRNDSSQKFGVRSGENVATKHFCG